MDGQAEVLTSFWQNRRHCGRGTAWIGTRRSAVQAGREMVRGGVVGRPMDSAGRARDAHADANATGREQRPVDGGSGSCCMPTTYKGSRAGGHEPEAGGSPNFAGGTRRRLGSKARRACATACAVLCDIVLVEKKTAHHDARRSNSQTQRQHYRIARRSPCQRSSSLVSHTPARRPRASCQHLAAVLRSALRPAAVPDAPRRRLVCSLRPASRLRTRPPAPTPTTASHDTPAEPSAPLPARWSLTNRLFNLVPRGLYDQPPRLPAARLWNPVNSSPRTLALAHDRRRSSITSFTVPQARAPVRTPLEPNVPVEHPAAGARDEYPLLTLPERRQSQQSPAPSSLVVERSTAGDSARQSIRLPRPPPLAMVVGQDHAPAPIRPDDPELGLPKSPSRVSIPSRPGSLHSRGASRQGDDADGDDASEFPWGPSHPCFPHPNPHVPLNSDLYENTRIIRIKRDWMVKGDLAPTFANLYPEILDPALSEEEFRKILQRINDTLVEAFNPFSFRAWLDSVMGVATFWLWDDAGLTKVKKQLAALERWIDDWNRDHGSKEGVMIIPLRRTGYLTLDIQIPDPHLGPDTGSRPTTHEEADSSAAVQQPPYATYTTTPTFQVNAPLAVESQS